MRTKHLTTVLDRNQIQKLLATGHEFDLESGGLFDARSGVVNFWASPEDKPSCWNIEITKGALPYPREYVGGVYWNWHESEDKFKLYLDASPYRMLENRSKQNALHENKLTDEQWESIFIWLEQKTQDLLRLAALQPEITGHGPTESEPRLLLRLTLRN